jgi:uncharacterized protein (DUF433 family)
VEGSLDPSEKEDVMNVNWKDHIVSTPDVIRGKPRIKGTRIPVSLILGYFAAGNTTEQIMAELSDLNREQIAACLDYARDLAEFEVAA